ncbi:MAG: hypothetical protein WAR22_13090, partial [Desulfomonilia bacterium]
AAAPPMSLDLPDGIVYVLRREKAPLGEVIDDIDDHVGCMVVLGFLSQITLARWEMGPTQVFFQTKRTLYHFSLNEFLMVFV